MQRAVDGDNITLSQHFLQILYTSATDLLLELRFQRLVVKIKQFFAVESFQSSQHTLADASYGNRAYNLVLKIIFTFGHSSHVPVAAGYLLVSRDKIANKNQDGHDDVLSDRHDVGSSDLGDSDTAVRLVRSIKINMIGSNTSCDRELEVLCFCKAFCSQIAGMKAARALN